jgi:superfamily II DNA or RNA helicase
MSIPIGRTDLIPEGYEVKDKRLLVPAEFPRFNGTLRESQQLVHDQLNDNCIINAKPSWGKTYAGLKIAGKLGQKTLVVVHTVPLRNQWAREVEKVYGITPGVIGSSKFNITPPIVIGNVQSLYNCMPQIQKTFGTIILDEMHHVSSPTFSRVIDKTYSRYKIGLSGTIKRKDGKDVVFCDYFGKTIFRPPPENAMTPEVDVIDCGIALPEVIGNNWAQRINQLMDIPEYKALIMRLADYYAKKGHKILVVQDRVEFAKSCVENRPKAVAITGALKDGREEEMDRIFTDIDEIWGITSIFKEGISKDILSCLILAGPINNEPMLEQLVGRIQRPQPNKLPPKVVDIKLAGWTGSKQFQARLGFYMRMGYKINYL